MAIHKGSAEWTGDLRSGEGRLKVGEGTWEASYSFASRFADGPGTSPEALIAAAHAGCFSMALCHRLAERGHAPRSVRTGARVELGPVNGLPTLRRIDLETEVDAAGLDEAGLLTLAEEAKVGCAVSRALQGVGLITVSARLIPGGHG